LFHITGRLWLSRDGPWRPDRQTLRQAGRNSIRGAPAAIGRWEAELPMDLADASLVLLAESLGHGRILTTDQRDFRTYRWKSRRPFEALLG